MKLGTVNLRSGGNVTSVRHLAEFMISRDCSTLIFSEFRDNRAGQVLLTELQERGFRYFAFSREVRGVLIVSREGFDASSNPGALATFPGAIIRADFSGYRVYAVYLPTGTRKFPHFDFLVKAAKIHNERGEAGVAIGDFNNGCDKIDIEVNARSGKLVDDFPAHSRYHELDAVWPEAWRFLYPNAREYSWYASNQPVSKGRGWRLDHAFISPGLVPRLSAATYLHETRTNGWSDHSALVVEISD